MKIRVATWNIASGRKMNSLAHFDYAKDEDLDYFASQLRLIDPDIICLQESQFNSVDSFAKRLGLSLGFPFVAETPGCPSHVDKNYKMTPAIVSRMPFESSIPFLLPHPQFKLIHKGKELPPFDRYLLEARFGNFSVVTAHPEPLAMFDLAYESGDGHKHADVIDEFICNRLAEPIVFAADFNFNNLPLVLPKTVSRFTLSEAMVGEDTTPLGDSPDHIAYSNDFKLVDSGIVKTETDHYLCWAELELR